MRFRWVAPLLALAACSRDNPEYGLDGTGRGSATAFDESGTTIGNGRPESTSGDPSGGSGDDQLDTTGDQPTGEVAEGCGDDSMCLMTPGDLWVGPVRIESLDNPSIGAPPCPDKRYDTLVQSGYTVADPVCCACTPAPFTCADPIAGQYSDALCMQAFGRPIQLDDCTLLENSGSAYSAYSVATFEAACTVSDPIVPLPVTVGRVAICGLGDDAPTCEGGVCVPASMDRDTTSRCIATDGEAECPDGWPEPTHVRVLSDNRVCDEPCTCGARGDTPSCVGVLDLFSDRGCMKLAESVQEPDCYAQDGAGGLTYASVSVLEVPAQCAPAEVGFSGRIDETIAITVCCKP